MGSLRPRQAWGLGVLVATIGLLGLVAVAADGSPLRAPLDDAGSSQGGRVLGLIEVGGLLAIVLGFVLLVVALTGERNRHRQFRNRRRFLRTVLLIAGALALLVAAPKLHNRPADPQQQPDGAGVVATTPVPTDSSGRPTWPIIVLGSGVVIALIGAAWLARRAVPGDEDADRPQGLEARRLAVRQALDRSLDGLLAEPDPRTAIIAAYARLLDGLAQCGLGRVNAEAPVEHLERALAALSVREQPLRALVALFAEARFSEHPLTAADKADAITAFRVARDDLMPLVVTA